MKILEVAGSGTIGTNDMGPVSNDIFQLSNHFYMLGHEVTIADVNINAHRELLPKGIKLIKTNAVSRQELLPVLSAKPNLAHKIWHKFLISYKPWLNEYRFIREIAFRLNLDDFDIIHVHEWKPALILQKVFRSNCVYTSHTPSWCNRLRYKGLRGKFRKFKLNLWMAMKIHEINVIKNSSLTIGMGDFLLEAVKDPIIKVIPNGTNLNQWNPMDKQKARKILGLNSADFILLNVGRIDLTKGVDVLLKAVRMLMPDLNNLKVVIIGSLSGSFSQRDKITPYSRIVLQQAEGLPVDFKGFVSNQSQEFQAYLSAADLFIMPSLFESQGNVVLEALSMGVPVVASETGGIPQMVTENVGSLFEPGNYYELAKQIKYFYNNRDKLESMRRRCRPHIEKNFTWRLCAEQHIKAFKEIIS